MQTRSMSGSVLITGGAGRVGSGVVGELISAGFDVHVLDQVAPADPPAGVTWTTGDIFDPTTLRSAIADAGAVVHLAAVPRPLGRDSTTILRTNVLGTHLVYEAAARSTVRTVVFLSSTAVIGTDWARNVVVPEYFPIDEAHPCKPHDPYGLSKLICEEIAEYAWRSWGLRTVILRAPWVVGPDELDELAARGGREPDGIHHYAYVSVRDLGRAVRLALERAPSMPGVTRLFVGAEDSTLGMPLADVSASLAQVPGARSLGPCRSGLDSTRALRVLGWAAVDGWRDRSGA